MTDKILFFAAIILFWRGWNKGFLRTVFGPVALVVCSIVSYFYYLWCHDIVIAAAIGIIAPIFLNIIFSITLNLVTTGKDRTSIALPSRVIAGFLNLLWGEFILIVVFLTVLMLPFDFPSLKKAQTDIQGSSSYAFIKPTMDQILASKHVQPIDPVKMAALSDPEKLKDLEKSSEYQTLVNDPRIQDLLTDPSIAQEIENKQISALIQNPKFLELTRDPELLKKFMALYSKMLK
jgi:hypothetical protein